MSKPVKTKLNSSAATPQRNSKKPASTSSWWKQLISRFQQIFHLTNQEKMVRAWLAKDKNYPRKLLIEAHALSINLRAYVPNYYHFLEFKNNRVLAKRTDLALDQVRKSLDESKLDDLKNHLCPQLLERWEKKNHLFLQYFLRLNLLPSKLIPHFNQYYKIVDNKIQLLAKVEFRLEQIKVLTSEAITNRLTTLVQQRLRYQLGRWLATNQTFLASWYNILKNTFFPASLIPLNIKEYFYYKNEVVYIANTILEPEKVFEIIEHTKLEMQKINEKTFAKFHLLKKLNTWFENNSPLLQIFVKNNMPLTLLSVDFEKYFDPKTFKLVRNFHFDEMIINRIVAISGFRLKQIINNYLLRQWITKNEPTLVGWKKAGLAFKILFPGFAEKIQVLDNEVHIRKNVTLQDVLVNHIIALDSNAIERALVVYKATKKLSAARDIFEKKGIWKTFWTSLFTRKVVLEGDEIPKITHRLDLNHFDVKTPPFHDFIAFKNNKTEYDKMRKTFSRKVLYKNHVVGLDDANIRPNEFIIEVKNISKYFVSGQKVNKLFHNLNLQIKRNDFVVILGPSGSGKTSLLNILSGLDQADVGDVFCNAINLTLLTNNDLTLFRRKHVSFIFQNYNLLPNLTALENVEIGAYLLPKGRTPFDIYELFETLEIDPQKNSYPSQLSGGQQQRVAIARALAKHPSILFCDEPTGALDQKMSKTVLKTLLDINKRYNMTTVLITHNVEFAKVANSVVYIKDGQIERHESIKKPISVDELTW